MGNGTKSNVGRRNNCLRAHAATRSKIATHSGLALPLHTVVPAVIDNRVPARYSCDAAGGSQQADHPCLSHKSEAQHRGTKAFRSRGMGLKDSAVLEATSYDGACLDDT
ncbi:hypothetical protein PspLS_10775 [Pyricularia sp. CBS 133598]|nr:hypothetical protein PspLS_10775 [Pyricularia sp. CBS 133598]